MLLPLMREEDPVKPSQVSFYTREERATLEIE
jgi:hypothetical protein